MVRVYRLAYQRAMDRAQMAERRQDCAGGPRTSHKMANSALKSFRYMMTLDDADATSGHGALYIDLTEVDAVPILPWEYSEGKGPAGSWSGETVDWSWRDYISKLDSALAESILGDNDLRVFAARACPFPSPYPGTAGLPHWEFSIVRSDDVFVGLHPPGRQG